ncbi:Eco57I restriction-modification methylase domain-containing protein [Mucilaginibacter terrae]|uniref:Eco57I restriction-modification methylase domain-containing protein n=1 Tax=Mucilaginibacter terrae TaxID=1955052 RepID=UPI00362D366D
MNFPSIDIQGSILSIDLLAKIRGEQANFQIGKDFNPDFNNAKLKDEISLAWQEVKGQWTIYKSKLARLKEGETATTETRNFWISPLLTNLGYNLTFNRTSEELNGKSFPIGYRDSSLDNFPVYVGGYNESLDKRPDNKQLRVSPHAMVQEYLNYSEHLYGLVTNGRLLRLLRDASRITRLSYAEFNLEKMMEEDLYSDFVILYRVLHASRMPKKMDTGAESIIEKYHQEGLEAGSTIRNKLGNAVKEAIKNLANGFVNHPDNIQLRETVTSGAFNIDEYYRHQLRVIYRLLFLFVIEERNLVYADNKTPETKRFNYIYYNCYSLLRLRKVARKLLSPEAHRHSDLWQSLVSTFSLFEKKEIGKKLGIMALQGDLFGYDAISSNQYDLHQCKLNNAVLLNIIKSLSYFENGNGVLISVNYGGLDVEEFGSVYEGLLELKLNVRKIEGSEEYSFGFDSSSERGKSGSHYTPEELVQPLIKYSLENLIEDRIKTFQQKKLTKENTIQSLLNLKVVDVACGSGHILLSAARRLALEVARVQTEEEQPNPLAVRKAMKEVVRNCIFGVDKNPLAVELCKIALWLEAYNPGEPLNFLDHHIKCGDSIVGLAYRSELEKGIADEAFKTLPVDDKSIASAFLKRNRSERKKLSSVGAGQQLTIEQQLVNTVQESMAEYKTFNHLPETTPEEIDSKAKAYKKFIDGKGFTFLKAMADTQVAQFFIPKTEANKDYLVTDGDFRLILSGYKGWQDIKVAKATAVALEQRFFHWFIEFPEVFNNGGFDCILGNPPFLGGQKLSGAFGNPFLEWIKYAYQPIGAVDLVTYFFRRIFNILRLGGFQSLISTNTIAQGSAREGGLDFICSEKGIINHAVRSKRWPGTANVDYVLVTIHKGDWNKDIILDGKSVERITPYLDDSQVIGNPFPLKANAKKSFQGSIVLGKGFVLSPQEAEALIKNNPRNKSVLYPYLNGDDLNNDPEQRPSRWVINFFDWSEEKARTYPDCFEIVEKHVKPERQRWKLDENENEIIGTYALRKPLPQKWWIYGEKRPALYETISQLDQVMVINRNTKYLLLDFQNSRDIVFTDSIVVIALDSYCDFAVLSSSIHEVWAWKHSSTKGSATLRYSGGKAFEAFPFPINNRNVELEKLGQNLNNSRKSLTANNQMGLTDLYNLVHTQMPSVEWDNSLIHIRNIQIAIDKAVMKSYEWDDIQLRHGFYEMDQLPENDRVRFTIHPEARKEILTRLLQLNHKTYMEVAEVKKTNKINNEPSLIDLFTNQE